ncbi:MAG: hypothetical protein WDO19_24350 [Bacteroidota bacterium]
MSDGSLYHHTGKLQTASGSISTTTGTETFKATFPNPLGIIQSGASATVRIRGTMIRHLLFLKQQRINCRTKALFINLSQAIKSSAFRLHLRLQAMVIF